MSLTKLSLARNNKIIPGQWKFGKWHPGLGGWGGGISNLFYSVSKTVIKKKDVENNIRKQTKSENRFRIQKKTRFLHACKQQKNNMNNKMFFKSLQPDIYNIYPCSMVIFIITGLSSIR